MLVPIVLGTVALLLLFAIGQLFPTKVFLGPQATRQKVMKFYGIPAAVGFVALMVLEPNEKAPTPATAAAATAPDSSEQDGRFKAVEFAGLTLPGQMNDAKTAGFTECTVDYYGYTCKRAAPVALLGITAKSAELVMSGRDHYAAQYLVPEGHSGDVRAIPAAELTYGEVTFAFAGPDYNWSCVEKHNKVNGGFDRPFSCVTNKNTIAHLTKELIDAGWVSKTWKSGTYYIHRDAKVEIDISGDEARIRRVTEKDVQDIIASEAKSRASKQAAESNAAQVLGQMRQQQH